MRSLGLALLTLALLCRAPHARAAGRAEDLFERGVTAFLAGKFQVGCPLIEQSYGLDPLPGVLFTLAECQLAWGKAKTAADNYNKFLDGLGRLPAAEASKHADRAAVAIRKRAEAVRNIAALTLRVTGDWIPGTRVSLDGRDVTLLVGKRIELDPGSHSVVLSEPGRPDIRRRVSLAPAESEELELVIAPPPPPQGEPAKGVPAHETPAPAKPTLAYVLGGVGLVGIAVGSVTGLMAQGEKSSIEENCPNRACNSAGREAVDNGQRLATISTISFGIGLAGLGAATYLFLRPSAASPSGTRAGPRVSVALGARPALAFTTAF